MNEHTFASPGSDAAATGDDRVLRAADPLPLILKLWRGQTSQDRGAAARAEVERAELEADTAIAVKRAEVRAAVETLWAEQQLASARIAVEAQAEIEREQHRRRVVEALDAPVQAQSERVIEPTPELPAAETSDNLPALVEATRSDVADPDDPGCHQGRGAVAPPVRAADHRECDRHHDKAAAQRAPGVRRDGGDSLLAQAHAQGERSLGGAWVRGHRAGRAGHGPGVGCVVCGASTNDDGTGTTPRTARSRRPSPVTACELTALEVGVAALDEGADALGGVSASEHGLIPFEQYRRCGITRCPLSGARGRERCLHRQRSVRGNQPGDFDGTVQVLAFRHDFVDEAGLQRGVRVEEFGRQQIPHARGAEAGRQPERRPTEGKDAARHLELRKAGALGRHRKLRRQRELDAERVAPAMHRNDDRLRTRFAEEVPWIKAVFGKQRADITGGDQRRHRRQVESGGEQPAVTEDHAGAQVLGIGQPLARAAYRLDHLEVPQVVRVGPVDADEQQWPVFFDRHLVSHASTVAC